MGNHSDFPFSAYIKDGKKVIAYNGNKILDRVDDLTELEVRPHSFEVYYDKDAFSDYFGFRGKSLLRGDVSPRRYWTSILNIYSVIFESIAEYFAKKKVKYVPPTAITKLALYESLISLRSKRGQQIKYFPYLTVEWFPEVNQKYDVQLTESEQVYLEMSLALTDSNQVYTIGNAFRRQRSDWFSLPEFHQVEYEAKLDDRYVKSGKALEFVKKELLDLLGKVVNDLMDKAWDDLSQFVDEDYLDTIQKAVKNPKTITLKEALKALRDTKHPDYEDQNKVLEVGLGLWEKIYISTKEDTSSKEDTLLFLEGMPYERAPLYLTYKGSEEKVADVASLLWPGYVDIAVLGHRARSPDEILDRIESFLLQWFEERSSSQEKEKKEEQLQDKEKQPLEESLKEYYRPYISIRGKLHEGYMYRETVGFGLGLERLVQALLRLPRITDATLFPRTHGHLSV